jgi:hypothetical protein
MSQLCLLRFATQLYIKIPRSYNKNLKKELGINTSYNIYLTNLFKLTLYIRKYKHILPLHSYRIK